MPSIRHVQQLIQWGNYAFSIDLKDAPLFVLLSITIAFYILCGPYGFHLTH